MPNKTANYDLNQWEPEDNFLRTDFNEDNAKIEEALTGLETQIKARCEVVFGTYTGNGASSRNIDLGFAPKALILENADGYRGSPGTGCAHGGLALQGYPACSNLTLTDTGFKLTNTVTYYSFNGTNLRYHYIAFK